MKELVIMKVGGSVITDKEAYLSVNKEALARIAIETASAKKEKGFDLLFVHGAGSFGHVKAKQHGLREGFKTLEQKKGFAETHYDVVSLNQMVCSDLLAVGINAVGVHPLEVAKQENKRISSFEVSVVKGLLERGFVPVVPGDVVLDEALGGSICSGDQSLSFLAKALGADRIVIGVDVDGVFTADPKTHPNAKLIPEINSGNINKIAGFLEEAKTQDVTGGMKGKIAELLEVAKTAPVTIVNACKEGRIKDALLGKKVIGTTITA